MTQTDEASIWRKLGDDADELAMRLQATPNAPRRVIEAAHGLLELHRKVRPELYSSPDRQNYTITVYRPQNRSRTIIALTALNNRTQAEALKALRATRKKLNPELAAELTDASGELVRSH